MHARCHFKQSNLCHDNSHAGQKISMIVSDPVDIGTRTNCRVGREDCTFDFEEREGPSLFFGRSLESKLGSFISFRLFLCLSSSCDVFHGRRRQAALFVSASLCRPSRVRWERASWRVPNGFHGCFCRRRRWRHLPMEA